MFVVRMVGTSECATEAWRFLTHEFPDDGLERGWWMGKRSITQGFI